MPIIYAANGMPHYVPTATIAREWIRKRGYSDKPRGSKPIATTNVSVDSSNVFYINRAGLTELTKITGVGVAKGKRILAEQPNITNIEALTNIVDDVDWYEPKIDGKIVVLSFDP